MNSKRDIFLKPRVQVSYLKIRDVLKPLYEGLNFIGRRKDATVIIENQNVSQYHAVITITDDKHFVSDTGSFNGSFLDKNKLQPLLLYELTDGSIIHFACVTAVYVKTPSNSEVVCPPQKNTQNLSESFFSCQTQQLETQGVEEVFNNCFDDDYDFNDVSTTPNVDTVVSVHDMPTQIFSSSHLKIIENCSPSKTGSPSIHDLATQINKHQDKPCSIHDLATQINKHQDKPCSIHEMPTQIFLSESNVGNEISITATNIDELATQFINLEKNINLLTAKVSKEIVMHELPTQISSADEPTIQKPQQDKEVEVCSALNENKDDSINKNQEQNNLLNSDKKEDILCQPSTSKGFESNAGGIIDDDCVIGAPEPERSMINVSDDIIDDSFLGNTSEVCENHEYLLLKSISKLTNSDQIPSQTPFHVSQPVGFSTIKKQCEPIVYSTSSSSEKSSSPISDDIIVPVQIKNCLRINSDSDTDMEDLPPASNSEIKKDTKNNNEDDSGSATDIENNLNVIKAVATKKVVRRRKKCKKIDSDSETDIENSNIEKFDSGSDTDIEDVPKISTPSPKTMSLKTKDKGNSNQLVGLDSKITVREEQDSDIIPCTQLSDDDIDDFNFGIGKNSTVAEKNNMEDISENFSLRMSSYTELSEEINNSKKIGTSVPINEIQLNICANSFNNSKSEQLIIEKIVPVTTKSTPEPLPALPTTSTLISDDLIAQPAQKIIPEKESLFVQPTPPTNIEKESDDIFVPPVDDDLFIQPTQKVIQTTRKTRSSLFNAPIQPLVSDDDLFIQPTQKITATSKNGTQDENVFIIPIGPAGESRSSSDDLFDQPTQSLVSNENCDDDLFMQPTQKLPQNLRTQEILFDQPTQPLSVDDKVDDLFLQPTQKIGEFSKPITSKEDNGHDLFLQPTQRIISTSDKQKDTENLFDQPTQELIIENRLNDYDCDDFFLQPTQKVVSTTSKSEENNRLFDQPTQPLTVENNLDDDFFLQPTQQITLPNAIASKSKSPLKAFSDNSEKGTSVESQLEVMFASQSLLPQSDSRPSNPLVSILEGNYRVDSEDTEIINLLGSEPVDQNEVNLNESLSSKPDEVITKKQTRSREKVVTKENVTVDNKNNLVSNEESKSNKRLKSTRRPSVDNSKLENDKMSTRRSQRTEIEEQEVKVNKQSKNEKDCSSKQLNEDHENEVTVEENVSSKEDEVMSTKQTRSKENVVAKKNVTVDNKNNLKSNEEEKSTKQLRSTKKSHADDVKVENDKMPTRKSQRTDSIKSSKKTEEQAVILNKQSKNSGGSQKNIEQSNEVKNEISKKNIENERLKVQDDKQSKKKDGNASQETKVAVETKINTRKRTTRSDSVNSQTSAKVVKKTKNNDNKCETSDQTDTIKSSSRLRNLRKDPNALNEIGYIIGTSKEVVKSDAVKPPTVTRSEVSTVTRSTRGAKKNLNSEQPLNDSVMIISSDNSDDDIILNKPRISKRKQESPTSSASSKRIKTSDTSTESAPINKKSKKIVKKIDEPANQNEANESDTTSNANSSNSSLRTPIRSRRLSSVGSINDTPNRNKRKQKPKVVFTMLDSPELESLIRSLGGSVVDTVNACTVLVTGSLKRSQKLLSAVGQAKPICSVKWLQECKKMSTFLDPWDFILEDEEAETKWNFSLKQSLTRSQSQKLLENYSILVLVTTAVDVLKAAIESCGGKCVSRAPADTKHFVVVASPENKKKYAKFIKQKVTIVSPEAIFDGVLRQELRFKDHLLS